MPRTILTSTLILVFAGLCAAQQPPPSPAAQGPQGAQDTSAFSDEVAYRVLSKVRQGMVGHSPTVLLSAFDPDRMEGYLTFRDQIQALFSQYEAFRVHFEIAQTTVEGTRGVVLVDFEIEEIPRSEIAPPVRKNAQVRFEMEQGKKGWKIVDFRPRGFFS